MKKAKFISLRTRLFIILSGLMGLILAVQFYLAYQAQQDLIDELNRLSNNINLAIDAHYAGVLQEIQESDQLVWKTDSSGFTNEPETFLLNVAPESLYTEVLVELKNIRTYSREIDNLRKKYDWEKQHELWQEKEEIEKFLELSREEHLTIQSHLDSLSENEKILL